MLEVKQLFDGETSTYTYLVWDELTREAVLIDSVKGQIERDIRLICDLELDVKYLLETHIHPNHITSSSVFRCMTPAKVVVHENTKSQYDNILAKDGDTFSIGKHLIRILHTPGHADTDLSYLIEDTVFTGDTLLTMGSERTDFQTSNAAKLYDSITKKLFTLPVNTIVYPGHDYKGRRSSTIGEEKKCNPRLGGNRSKDAFIHIMNALKPACARAILSTGNHK